ncbi:hypothetical protein DVS28_b0299 (plasmid) [Euzebya pacifica]|uniref:Uncharacterized protein n=1 Tax=Euzebya pacifica TaxID=1608957 RepID=A0A346Y6H2_9ACTN|nr:hypothetical protein [Euzebya pacifica]AXV10069.1 hypothetical protein DVS28_b0299 [Euzebya pacifica]
MPHFTATVAHAATNDGRLLFPTRDQPGLTGFDQTIVAFDRHPDTVTVPAPDDAGDEAWMHAAERMWMLANLHPAEASGPDAIEPPGDITNEELGWMTSYRNAGNRSLCVGDIVLLTGPDGTEAAYQALTIGFGPLDTDGVPIRDRQPPRT